MSLCHRITQSSFMKENFKIHWMHRKRHLQSAHFGARQQTKSCFWSESEVRREILV